MDAKARLTPAVDGARARAQTVDMALDGSQLPRINAPLPADASRAWIDRLAASESPAFTARRKRREESSGATHDPIVWSEAFGANVRDVDDNVYVDLTSGFGAALIGHRHPNVVAALQAQSNKLLHALGDYHPSDVKVSLLEKLATLGPWPDTNVALSLGGADAVTTALKTAVLATGRSGIVAFANGYHGLLYGPLSASSFQPAFREPFRAQLNPNVTFLPWPAEGVSPSTLANQAGVNWAETGAVIIEPVQGRGGVRVPPEGFLSSLRSLAHTHGALLIADEIMTGLGRCGAWWRSVDDNCVPDLICAGKALGGGLPVSACLGDAQVMKAWGTPDQIPIHTGTFYGNPLGSAAALAALEVIEQTNIVGHAATLGRFFGDALHAAVGKRVVAIRQVGLMVGVELTSARETLKVVGALLTRGYIALPAGSAGNVIQLLPTATIAPAILTEFARTLAEVLEELGT